MKLRILNEVGTEIFSELSPSCNGCIQACNTESISLTCNLHNDKRRVGKIRNADGEIFACTTDKDLIKSSRTFKSQMQIRTIGLGELSRTKKSLNQETKRLIHNLTSLNGHNIQELYALVPQDILTKDLKNQLSIIERTITDNPKEAAKAFLRIVKNNASIKTEFSVFNRLVDGTRPQKKKHNIKKVVLNLFHIFFQDFAEVDVYVQFSDCDESLIFDYESMHVALYHLIDNATKYVLPSSKINVSFIKTETDFFINMDMLSLRIEPEELNRLFEESYSGKLARQLNKAGSGIGLHTAVRALELNDAELIIVPKIDDRGARKVSGVNFDHNRFQIKFRNYKKATAN